MAIDTLVNNASTTVSSGGTDAPAAGTSESWTVASSTGFPAVTSGINQFRIQDPAAPSEIMIVTAISGTAWTVTRGAEGTTPVTHASGFTVDAVATAGALSSPLPTLTGSLQASSLYVPSQWTGASHSNTPTLNAISVAAFWLAGDSTITGLGTKTPSTTVGAYMRLGIYLDNGSGLPGQLLVDAGQINGDSGVDQELTFTGIPLQGGQWLWLAACAQGVTQSYRVLNQNTQSGPVPLLAGNFDNAGAAGYVTTAATYSSGLPTPFPAASPNATEVVSVIVFTS